MTLSTALTYDCSLGKPITIKDQASPGPVTISTTSASYGNGGNDMLDRLSSVTWGSGSTSRTAAAPTQTVYAYNDSPGSLEVDTCQDLNVYQETTLSGAACTGGVKTARLFDGFGQPIEARTYESATGYISTQTVYDGLERVYSVTNPFRPATDTAQLTLTSYDAAGRPLATTSPDGSTVSRAYAGNRTEIKVSAINAAGFNRRWLYTDGLGRTAEVVEDPDSGGLGYETDYLYTALDQLTQVSQGAETRNFYYDSLKRLTRAVNVETGSICYGTSQSGNNRVGGYDGNGNLPAKSDGRGYTATMTYDALNRMTAKTYSVAADVNRPGDIVSHVYATEGFTGRSGADRIGLN